MNKKHFDIAIEVMQRAAEEHYKFNALRWQRLEWRIINTRPLQAKTDEESLRDCGMAACFGGWLAVSPEFQDAGGSCDREGRPVYKNYSACSAIALFLGISTSNSWLLCAAGSASDLFYNVKDFNDITAHMVAEKLIDMRDNPEKYGE
jgi:hypothetical protein